MGFDVDGIRILAHARTKGVDFSRTIMLGRQKIHVRKDYLPQLLSRIEPKLDVADFLKKHNSNERFAEPLLRVLGADVTDSMDADQFEGANIIHDLNQPIPEDLMNRYSVVIDGGCIEHVFNVAQALKNAANLIEVGGHYIGLTIMNNFCGHGFYQFSPELFFRYFCTENGFSSPLVFCYEANQYDRARFFQITDPLEIGQRLDLANGVPLYLAVISEKVGELGKGHCPYQSDYSTAWRNSGQACSGQNHSVSEASVPRKVSILNRIAALLAHAAGVPIVGKPFGSIRGRGISPYDLET